MLRGVQPEYEFNSIQSDGGVHKELDDDCSQGGYNLPLNGVFQSAGMFSLNHITPLASWSYSSSVTEGSSVLLGSGNAAQTVGSLLTDVDRFVYQINPSFFNFVVTSSNDSFGSYVQLGDGSYAYLVPRTSQYHLHADIPFNFSIADPASGGTVIKALAIFEQNVNPNGTGSWTMISSSHFSYVEQGIVPSSYAWDPNLSDIFLDNDTWFSGNDSPIKCVCTVDGDTILNNGVYVRLSFFIIRLRNFFPTTNVNFGRLSFRNRFGSSPVPNIRGGIMTITDNINTVVAPITGSVYTFGDIFSVSGSLTGSLSNVITFTDSASILYNKIQFDESNSPISSLYSPIAYPFNLQIGDVFRIGSYYQTNPPYYTVIGITSPITGSDGISVTRDLSVTLDKSLSVSAAASSKFVIFRRLPDETSVILDFSKNPGSTSKAVLIPYNIDLDVKSKVADIFASINQDISV
jgi:hypothetical protein